MPRLAAVLLAVAVLVWPRPPDVRARLSGVASTGRPERAPATLPVLTRRAIAAVHRRRRAAAGADLDRDLLALLEGLAAALRAGLTPARALAHLERVDRSGSADGADTGSADRLLPVGPSPDLVARLAGQAAAGARLEPVWRAAAVRSGRPALLAVAEGWRMSEQHGAPIVDVLDALAEALRDHARTAAAIQTALAAPRATAALLGVLPLGGLALGELVGVHPVSVLLGTGPGRVAGVAGLAATLAGRLWMRRLVASAGRG